MACGPVGLPANYVYKCGFARRKTGVASIEAKPDATPSIAPDPTYPSKTHQVRNSQKAWHLGAENCLGALGSFFDALPGRTPEPDNLGGPVTGYSEAGYGDSGLNNQHLLSGLVKHRRDGVGIRI